MTTKILQVKNLKTNFISKKLYTQAIRGVSFDVEEGEILGIVGESGSGKSVTMKTVMGLLPENAEVSCDELLFEGQDLSKYSKEQYRQIRGKKMAMIFQDPMTSLNPVKKIGDHLTEVIKRHNPCTKQEATNTAIKMLQLVGIPNPEARLKQYPHEFSGGMRQRILIGMALCCEPQLLIADEPTTALDVTIQAQILELLKQLNQNNNTSIVLITHDMGVVAAVCTRLIIMYGGQIMEEGTVDEIFYTPKHPYTKALLQAIPTIDLRPGERLKSIDGMPPSLTNPPVGCPFAPRCTIAIKKCYETNPSYKQYSPTHRAMCFCGEKDNNQEVK